MLIAPLAHNARRVQALIGIAAILNIALPAALSQSPQQSQLTLQMQAPLVVEDVVVLDSHNQPVHGLTAANFTVTDDGKPVTPRYFEEHAAVQLPAVAPSPAAEPAPAQPDAASPPAASVFTNRDAVPTGAPLNILLLDALNTPMKDQVNIRRQMLKFLTNLPSGTPIAIYGLSSHLYLLQGFTSDPSILKAALTAKGSGAQASILLDNPASGGPGAEADALDSFGLLTQGNSGKLSTLLGMQMFIQGDVATYQNTQRSQLTLAAFAQLARYLSILPGRKNLIWFSGSFPLDINPSATQTSAAIYASQGSNGDTEVSNSQDMAGMFGSSAQAHFGNAVRDLDDQLRRSQIAIYPVDARGLFDDASIQASSNTHVGTQLTQQQMQALAGGANVEHIGAGTGSGSISMASDSASNFAAETSEEHATMNQMADETGGKAFYNNGDLMAAVKTAMALGSNYYTVSYTPPSGAWDGKHHKIEVKVNQPGLHLTYRRAYFADNPSPGKPGQPVPQPSSMAAAMLHGAPDPGGLVFDVTATSADNASGQLTPGSRPDPKLMQPPYRTCTLEAHLDIRTLSMTANASGAQEGTIEFAMVVYDANGDVINQGARVGHVVLPPDRYTQVLAHGLAIRQSIDVPARGIYFIRVGFHDPASDRVGAVEIPVAALQSAPSVAQAAGQSPPAQP